MLVIEIEAMGVTWVNNRWSTDRYGEIDDG